MHSNRLWLITGFFGIAFVALIWRAIDLQLMHKDFLQDHGEARYLRIVSVPAHRGIIVDRNDDPLAISTPVQSIWVIPRVLLASAQDVSDLADLLIMERDQLHQYLSNRKEREFLYLKRHLDPDYANKIIKKALPGVYLQQEYRRYYPAGETTGHLIGFTNLDDQGQEGIELAYDKLLLGIDGTKRVIRDRLGRVVENVESIKAPQPGKKLVLSIDRRIQYLAYKELKSAVQKHRAVGGSLVVLDVDRGEILAMVNQPAFNPNNRADRISENYRNRSVTDAFEPGSTVKPITIAAALESGEFSPGTLIDTKPGRLEVGRHVISDVKNHGLIDVSTVIAKSSNVGASKIALSLPSDSLWGMFSGVGFGARTDSGLPGESSGKLLDSRQWQKIEKATLSFGYGLSVTTLQLAKAYMILAADGISLPISITRDKDDVNAKKVMSSNTARQIRSILEQVVHGGGTGKSAQVSGYRVAGKTGTVHKSTIGGYAKNRYVALFSGMAPASRPRLIVAVMIDEPSNGVYFGGKVSAPIFSKVMAGALRMLDIPPDDLPLTLGNEYINTNNFVSELPRG